MTRVMTVLGTRPEIIRLSRVISLLDEALDHVLIHTGQNWDPMLSDAFFEELELRKPDRFLGVETSSLGRVLGDVLVGVEEAINDYRPDALLVLGDTNSCIAALMGRRMKVPVYHMEAGNRCFDLNVPEETNRRMVDHVSDFNLVYTEHARRNLLAEGLHPRRVLHTGSPMREVLDYYRKNIDASPVLDRLGLKPGGYFLVSAHREENVDDPERLGKLLDCLRAVRDTYELPVHVSTHPRTAKRLLEHTNETSSLQNIEFHRPFGFADYNRLQMEAKCTLSDSGTISEESAILGFPAVTLRDSIERPEAIESGTIVMVGLEIDAVLEGIRAATYASRKEIPCPPDYRISTTSTIVLDMILSTYHRHHEWSGIRTQSKSPRI